MAKLDDYDLEQIRYEQYAEDMLENELYRLRWTAELRDAIAARLQSIVQKERRIARGQPRG